MKAADAVAAAVEAAPDALFVASLGTATSALRLASGDGPHLYLGGAMGCGLATALGVADCRPDRSVVAIVGDGDLLMGASSLWTLSGLALRNLRRARARRRPLLDHRRTGAGRSRARSARSRDPSRASQTAEAVTRGGRHRQRARPSPPRDRARRDRRARVAGPEPVRRPAPGARAVQRSRPASELARVARNVGRRVR